MDPLFWSIILLVVGLFLLLLEIFVPSGGILGFLSVSSVLAAIITAFYNRGVEVGLIFVVITAFAVPAILVAAFRFWPHTPMGRRVLLNIPTEEEVLPDTPQRRTLRKLVGKVGVAKSMMLPSGAIAVEGLIVDAVSEGVAIEPGQHVRVIQVHGNRVVVSPTDEAPTGVEASKRDPNDILNQPIESLGLDDEPLA
jgi:membrane-bound serine protease (ClpP class)